jgi:hypothetical protein
MTQGGGSSGGERFEGRGPDLHAATQDAWRKAKQSPNSPNSFKIAEIRVTGTNPLHEYRVVLTP